MKEESKWYKISFQEKDKLKITSLGFFIFELLIFISILLGFFYLWYVMNLLTFEILSEAGISVLFDMAYITMSIILIFLCFEEIRFDHNFPKKRRYNGYLILVSLILFNSQYYILSIKTVLQIEVNFYDLIVFAVNYGIGILLLFMVLLKSIFIKIRGRLELEESLAFSPKTQKIFYLSQSSFIIATICLIVVAFNGVLAFTFKGATIFSGQGIWALWNWLDFTRNMLIVMSFVIFFLFVEIRYDVFFDFDDRVSDRIRSWFSRVFRRR